MLQPVHAKICEVHMYERMLRIAIHMHGHLSHQDFLSLLDDAASVILLITKTSKMTVYEIRAI